MGYRDDPKTRNAFWAGSRARENGETLESCPFKGETSIKRKAWMTAWKEKNERLNPKHVVEREWLRRISRERFNINHLPTSDHFCNTWDAEQCVCQGHCGCHYQGVRRRDRTRLIRMDHICTWKNPRPGWVVLVHGCLPNPTDSPHWRCEACEEALARGEKAFKDGEILTLDQATKAYTDGRKCFDPYGEGSCRRWRHLCS